MERENLTASRCRDSFHPEMARYCILQLACPKIWGKLYRPVSLAKGAFTNIRIGYFMLVVENYLDCVLGLDFSKTLKKRPYFRELPCLPAESG
jgi:hypothetical protein